MQIRLTVVDPTGAPADSRPRAASCDVLVTAPAGTALAAVASALAAAVCGEGAAPSSSAAAVVLYAGVERLDAQRCTLGEPPLTDGAVLSLGAPADPEPHPEVDDAPARLHVVAGPDAGGVHLLHGGQVRVGRSADADVPLDDPDVSRLHCAVTLSPEGRVTVADLGSTNGTTLDGAPVPERPVRLPAGALLRVGESALRLAPPGGPGPRVATTPDGEGHVRVPCGSAAQQDAQSAHPRVNGSGAPDGDGAGTGGTASDRPHDPSGHGASGHGPGAAGPAGATAHAYGTVDWGGASRARGVVPEPRRHGLGGASPAPPVVPGQGTAPSVETRPGGETRPPGGSSPAGPSAAGDASSATHGGRARPGSLAAGHDDARGPHGASDDTAAHHLSFLADGDREGRAGTGGHSGHDAGDAGEHGVDDGPRGSGRRKGTPLRGTDVPPGVRRRGLSAWARRLAGGRGPAADQADAGSGEEPVAGAEPQPAAVPTAAPETWPDPAALLLTALGPGPRLWERAPGHPEALAVRLGTADRAAPDGSGLLPAVPVTAGLREVGALGLAGPRPRLAGLARAVLAQLAALHSPETLEVVLISTDRGRSEEERTAEWSWLGWLPHLRPGHGQDCRLLLAYDRDQATARADELLRRLEDCLSDGTAGDARPSPPTGAARRPSWAVTDDSAGGAFPGPYTVVVVDGDPGGADLREAVARLAVAGPRAGIHVVCLAETPAASPSSPVSETYEAACAAAPTFRACGAVALLSGDVATALRLLRVAPAGARSERPGPVGPGTVGAVDAVSLAWAERFARALAPLRPDGAAGGERHPRVSAPLPASARLLDELGLARATPASLMARWAAAADDADALGGRAWAVLGAGPRGPVGVDLAAEGPHLLIEGPTGSGRTELLRAVVASLAAAERPDRLSVILLDGRDTVGKGGGGPGDGLRVCTDLPHVTTHLTANDPVRMREFAQSLSAELKRRTELLGRSDFAEWHTHRAVSGRIVPQRTAKPQRTANPSSAAAPGSAGGAADLDAPPSSTLRLRPGATARQQAEAAPPLPRLVVVVDDLDALVSPALGSPGRPAAGSVMRALEAVAREGERLGVHLVAATGPGGRTAESEPARRSTVRITLEAPVSGPDEPAPGRGRLRGADGRLTPFQGGRVTGRIPRTATLRPTVVPLEWARMGDPPTRRPVRELGNGPTDLALLASALERAARHPSPSGVH
ncbi:FHA domain-containing protein [Streptomyces hilarionis]|uniref:FHA domain-containing protein n=1 Tax=Streptomyces hilarionis TaxID=2839954 RepID=UPI00211A4A5D|nr:FHA domain-containing protein [Streptomyces hilarionis]MCQ9133749.1 FHA domain-containing protein [Streptomyces hilarionis]